MPATTDLRDKVDGNYQALPFKGTQPLIVRQLLFEVRLCFEASGYWTFNLARSFRQPGPRRISSTSKHLVDQ